jgi:hypothetical protein
MLIYAKWTYLYAFFPGKMSNRRANKKIETKNEETKSKGSSSESMPRKAHHPRHVHHENTPSDRNKLILVPVVIIIAIFSSWYYNYWLASLVNKQLNEPKIIEESSYKSVENLDRFWGTYR